MTKEELDYSLKIVATKISEFEKALAELLKSPTEPNQQLKIEKACKQLQTARAWKELLGGG